MADSTSFPRWFKWLLDRFFPARGWPEDPFERQIVGRVPPPVEGDTVTETVRLACGHKLDLVYHRIQRVNCAQCAAGLPAGDAAAATAATNPHAFKGRLDRWCEVEGCNLPDRDPIHKVSPC